MSNLPARLLSQREFSEQVTTACELTDTIYQTDEELLMLGFTVEQVQLLQSIYMAVREEKVGSSGRNDEAYPFYKHFAKFENEYGALGYAFSGNGDYHVTGVIQTEIWSTYKFSRHSDPIFFILAKEGSKSIPLQEIGERIFRGESMDQVNAYEAYWLDESTQLDAAFHFPLDGSTMIFRKVLDTQTHEVWGKRVDTKNITE